MILDSSALLAYIFRETGWERVGEDLFQGSEICSVNLAEVVAKLAEKGRSDAEIDTALSLDTLTVRQFTEPEARVAGILRLQTRDAGLSLGDRCCIAAAIVKGTPILTADRAWAQLDVGVTIELCR